MEWRDKLKEGLGQIGYIRITLLLISIIFLIGVSIPGREEESRKENIVSMTSEEETVNGEEDKYKTENDIYIGKMEERLASVLEMIEGAGRVQVMMTLASSAEVIIDKDVQTEENIETEEGQKETRGINRQEETVIVEKEGNQTPYVIKRIEPVIEGVIIVMEGGGNEFVAEAVREAVQALFQLETHKIKVLKMEEDI